MLVRLPLLMIVLILLLLSIIRPFAQLPHTTANYQEEFFIFWLFINFFFQSSELLHLNNYGT